MFRFILGRCGWGLLTVWIVVTIIFSALHIVPGDPALLLLSGDGGGAPSPEAVAKVRKSLGLDEPILVQYLHYLGGLVRGDWGTSFRDGFPVTGYIGDRLPRTLELVGVAAAIAVIVGVPLGAFAARRGGIVDSAVSVVTMVGIALPAYAVGTLLVLVFALTWRLFPAGGYVSFADDPGSHLGRLILPAVAVSLGITATLTRMTRSSVLETMGKEWVSTARSVGLRPSEVFTKHVMRNSLNPVVTSFGLEVGTLIGSTVLIERVFNWPGLGSLLIDGVLHRDYPVVQGVAIVTSVVFVLINIVIDISYGLLDPRVRRA